MLPSVLEIYVIWHPSDPEGARIADDLAEHFQGSSFTGLMSGAVEVFVRSEGWSSIADAPRPIPFPGDGEDKAEAAELIALVPVLGSGLADAVQSGAGPWHEYLDSLLAGAGQSPDRVGVFPVLLDSSAIHKTRLGELLGKFQSLGRGPGSAGNVEEARCRDLAQGVAQLAASGKHSRVTVFISHTRHAAAVDRVDVSRLIELVRSTISETRLAGFLDTNDLQPGCEWDSELRSNVATSALLAVRTELYASREWCQREMLIAKRAGMPVVVLEALTGYEERGSFLMDHVPRVRVEHATDGWSPEGIRRGLNLLVNEHLKRVLWRRQEDLARAAAEADVAWWAPHAPEPTTLTHWLSEQREAGRDFSAGPVRILHPDPPMGSDERLVLDEMAAASGVTGGLDVTTPQMLAARGGWRGGEP